MVRGCAILAFHFAFLKENILIKTIFHSVDYYYVFHFGANFSVPLRKLKATIYAAQVFTFIIHFQILLISEFLQFCSTLLF